MRRALILWNTVALLILFAVLGITTRAIVHNGMYAAVDRELEIRTEVFLSHPDPPPLPKPRGQSRGNPFKIHLFDLSEHSLSPPGNYPLWDRAAYYRCQSGTRLHTRILRDGEPLRVFSGPVYHQGRLIGVVQAPYPVAEVEKAGTLLDQTLGAMFPLVIIVAWGGATLMTGRVLHPIRQLITATDRISAQNLSERLPLVGKDEFAVLAATFNRLLGRVEGEYQRQKQFTEDASHELKTPLTRIKGTASMALAGPPTTERLTAALENIDRASDAMSTLVQDLLLLAQGDAGYLGENRRTIKARDLLEHARDCMTRPDGARISVSVEPENLVVVANETEILRVLMNLLDNALRYTPSDGAITLVARPGFFSVSDTGCGIAEQHLERLGERFYRIDPARTRRSGGTGLGLAICKSIVSAHGGSMTIASQPDIGTTVTLNFTTP